MKIQVNNNTIKVLEGKEQLKQKENYRHKISSNFRIKQI